MKQFLKAQEDKKSNVLITQRVDILLRSLNTTISIEDLKLKKNLVKKPFWVGSVVRPATETKLDSVWTEVSSR